MGCSVVNDADVCDVVGFVVTYAALCADCVVTTVICGGETLDAVLCVDVVDDSVVSRIDCVGTVVETV